MNSSLIKINEYTYMRIFIYKLSIDDKWHRFSVLYDNEKTPLIYDDFFMFDNGVKFAKYLMENSSHEFINNLKSLLNEQK